MRRSASFAAALVMAAGLVVISGPTSSAVYVPRTLASTVAVVPGRVVDPAFDVDFVAVQWDGEHGAASVRARHDGRWGSWRPLVEDGVEVEGKYASAPLAVHDADAVQVRVPRGVRRARVTAINTTDGERVRVGARTTGAHAATPVVTRAQWGADESLRFDNGVERFPPTYYPVQKLTVHHTATANDDPDPAATVRAIYRMHAVERNFGDIGYHFLIGADGQVFEGRWSGTDGVPAHDASGKGVTAAHVGGHNSGNLGVSLLGTFTATLPTAAARASAESILADLARRHRLNPEGSSTYVNPVSGATKQVANISGHRDWAATECPGGAWYAELPALRAAVANRVPPVLTSIRAVLVTRSAATIRWTSDEPATGRVEYWTTGAPTRTPTATTLTTTHSIPLRYLRKATRYYYRVRSVDRAGNATLSPTYSFTTPR